MEMGGLTRDGTAEPVSRDQTIRRVRGQQGNILFPCSADHEQDWQPYPPVDPYSAICDDHTYRRDCAYLPHLGDFVEPPPKSNSKTRGQLGGVGGSGLALAILVGLANRNWWLANRN